MKISIDEMKDLIGFDPEEMGYLKGQINELRDSVAYWLNKYEVLLGQHQEADIQQRLDRDGKRRMQDSDG